LGLDEKGLGVEGEKKKQRRVLAWLEIRVKEARRTPRHSRGVWMCAVDP